MKSCIYEGRLRHRRYEPVENVFTYRLFMMYLDLGELPTVFKGRWFWSADRPAPAWFRRRDYLGDPNLPLGVAVRDLVQKRTGSRPAGPIRLLTHLRYFGYCFNPVSFYYCYDPSDTKVETIVAEITNTPWGERHSYVLPESMNLADGRKKRFRFEKSFHVSPFMDMDMRYDWRLPEPGRALVVHMENDLDGSRFFDATLTLTRKEIDTVSLARVLALYPLMTAKVTAAIYWQAFRLWWKKCPYYAHPTHRNNEQNAVSS